MMQTPVWLVKGGCGADVVLGGFSEPWTALEVPGWPLIAPAGCGLLALALELPSVSSQPSHSLPKLAQAPAGSYGPRPYRVNEN